MAPSLRDRHSMTSRRSYRDEEYLEAILVLEEEKGVARVSEIARILGVKPPSVVEYLERLSKRGLVLYVKGSGTVKLTAEGRRIAENVHRKHRVLVRFLRALGIEESLAEEEACRMEHVVSDEVFEVLKKLLEFLENYCNGALLKLFREFVETGEIPACPIGSPGMPTM